MMAWDSGKTWWQKLAPWLGLAAIIVLADQLTKIVIERKFDFGDILHSTVEEIWNNHHYRSARMLFNRRPPKAGRVSVVCDLCPIFRQARHRTCGVESHPFVSDYVTRPGAIAGR